MYFLIFSDSVDVILWSNGQAMSTRVAVLLALSIITISGLLFFIVLSVIIGLSQYTANFSDSNTGLGLYL